MGIKFNESKNNWESFYCKRHPLTGKPKSMKRINLKSKAEAKRVERELIIELSQRLKASIVPCWNKIIDGYVKNMRERGLSIKTIENYKLCLISYTEGWEKRLVDEITTEDVRGIINIRAAEVSQSQQKNILKYLRGAFNYAMEIGVINRNPVPKMKFKIGNKIKGVLTREQIKHFLTQAKLKNNEWYQVWAMACYTGMRTGELYALRWDHVNLEQRQILVSSSWNSEDGFKDTKSGDDRITEIAPELLYILKEMKLKNHDSEFVLPRIEQWTKGGQARVLREFLESIGIAGVRFHDLRASWATVMLSIGVEPIKVMAVGGWSDLKTLQIYIRKAGINTKGTSEQLSLHTPGQTADVLRIC